MSAGGDTPAPCELGEIAVGWVLHALEPDDEHRLVEHLPQCAECRRTLREAREVTTLLAASVPALDPPPALRGRVLAAAQAGDDDDVAGSVAEPNEWSVLALAEPTRPAAHRGPPKSRRRSNGAGPARASGPPQPSGPAGPRPSAPRRTGPLAGLPRRGLALVVGAFVLVAALAIGGVSISTSPDAPPALAERADQVVGDAQARDPGVHTATLRLSTGTPVAVVLDNGSGPRVVPIGLPPLRPDHQYWLWRLGTGPAPAAVGSVGPSGLTPTEVSPPAGGAASAVAAYAVSSEPSGAVPKQPTAVVAIGQYV